MAQQLGRGSAALDQRAVGREAAAHDGDAALGRERLVERRDHRRGRATSAPAKPSASVRAGDGQGVAVQRAAQLAQHGADPAGVVQLLDEVLARRAARSTSSGVRCEISWKRSSVSGTPTRPAIASRWITAFVPPPIAISTVIALSNASAVRICDGGGPSSRELDRARARRLGGARAGGVDGRDRRGAGQAHAERLDERGHRRGGPHLVAVADAGRRGRLELVELLLRHPPGAQLVGVVPEVGAGAELPAAEQRRLATGRR